MKRFTLLTFVLVLGLALVCAGPVSAKMTLKLATVTPTKHAYNDGAREFARLVKEGTNGEVEIKVYPGGQLGKGERELLEGMQMGIIDIAVTSTGPLSNFSPDMGVVDLPFLFLSNEHVDKVLDGPVGRNLLDGLEKANLKGLAFMENGFRNFTNSARPLEKPEDLKGLKFRTMENPVHLASVRSIGAQAVPMSWGEVYTSLQTGVIDGQENPVAIIWVNKMNEVQKYLSLTGHFYSPAPLTMSKRKFDKLKPEWQELFIKAALEAAAFERKVIRDAEIKQVEDLKSWGMDVRTVDKQLFVEAMKPAYTDFYKKNPSWKAIVIEVKATK
jgi:tripartite ATP-independent transporter DctP family solute receptor